MLRITCTRVMYVKYDGGSITGRVRGEGGEETIKYIFMLALRERKLHIEVLRRQLREQKT